MAIVEPKRTLVLVTAVIAVAYVPRRGACAAVAPRLVGARGFGVARTAQTFVDVRAVDAVSGVSTWTGARELAAIQIDTRLGNDAAVPLLLAHVDEHNADDARGCVHNHFKAVHQAAAAHLCHDRRGQPPP